VDLCPSSSLQSHLAPSYFHLIGSLKDALRRRRFVEDSMPEELSLFSRVFYTNVIHTLMQRWKINELMMET
jgi:hypothetical protein